MRRFNLLVLSFWLLVGCKNKVEYIGDKVLKYYPNGSLEFEREMADGKKNGKAVEYFSNGVIKSISVYKNDSLQGELLKFYPNGKLEMKVCFENGKQQGMAYYFYPSGVISAFRYWKDDKINGYASDYWDTIGEVKAALRFDDSGKIIYKKNFDEFGKFVGQE